MTVKKLFLLIFIIPFFAFTAHKYYLSLTQIEFNSKTESLEIIINVFIDDIETALNKIHSKNFELDSKNEPKNSDIYFYKYLQENLHLKVNETPVKFNYIGKEYDGEVVFFYLEVKNINTVKSLDINSSILIDYFPNQQNLIKSNIRKKYKSLMLTNKKQSGIIKY